MASVQTATSTIAVHQRLCPDRPALVSGSIANRTILTITRNALQPSMFVDGNNSNNGLDT